MSKEKSVRPGYKKITFGRVLSTIIVIDLKQSVGNNLVV